LAGSGSTAKITSAQRVSRWLKAVSPAATSWAAPSIGYMCIVECIEGSFWPHSRWRSMASSDSSSTKSARQ
jgi:hypothetical protein